MWAWASAALIAATCIAAGPRDLTLDEKRHFYLKSEASVLLSDSLQEERDAFDAPLKSALGRAPVISWSSESDRLPEGIIVGTAADPGALQKRKYKRYLDGAAALGAEGYQIVVGNDGIVVIGGGVRGAWYGLHTLAALVEQYGSNLPHMNLRDWPELTLRGACLKTMPDETDLLRLAAMKCNYVFFESDAFHDLTGVQATAWRNTFELARKNFLEPVPVFSTLRGMENVLRERPLMIEGRAVAEPIALRGTDWVPLRYPNIIAEHPETVRVSISGVTCVLGRDYLMEPQPLVAPFSSDRPRWRIRREPGGTIPDGAEVEVRYSIATEDSDSLCFAAPESRAWLRTALERLITELEPRFIHLDHGSIGRMNQDTRSLGRNVTNADAFAQSLALMSGMAREIDERVGLMMWSDLLNPGQGAVTYGLADATVPEEITRLARFRAGAPREAAERFEQTAPIASTPLIAAIDGNAAAAFELQQLMIGKGLRGGGLIALAESPEAAAPVLEVAWAGSTRGSVWVRLLNNYFDANLDQPDFPTVRAALVQYVNTQTLRGNSPPDVYQRFEAHCASHPDVVASDQAGFELARALLESLTKYLTLEERFAQTGGGDALNALDALVERVRSLDPEGDAARYGALKALIGDRKQFASASMLFEDDLRYYRPDRSVQRSYEIPIQPVMASASGQVVATIPLMPGQAPVRRLEIEGTDIGSALLSGSYGNAPFEDMQRWTGAGLAGVRGALLLTALAGHHTLRFTAAGTSAQPVLEVVRVFGEKPAAEIACGYAAVQPDFAAVFDARPWSSQPQAGAFLQVNRPQFAQAPTAVRVTRTRDDLYVAVEASEAHPEAMIADFRLRDAPLWEQESVEIWIQPEGRLPLRLVASPLGTRYDSEANDGGWDGEWEAVARKTETGWNVLVRIPVAMTGEPQRGSSVLFNVVRNRRGGGDERSAWAHAYGAQPDLQWGRLTFP